jgi:F0F1-type ATP synthase assembly protein I
MSQPEKAFSSFAKLGKYLALGLEVPSTIVGSLVLGWFLDHEFETAPWAMVICAVLGFVAAVVRLIQYLRYFSKKQI